MTFLSPSILWALFAVSIPIIIHLISLRQTRYEEFSSLRFIKFLEHKTIRSLKINQWLLIFLRTIAILCHGLQYLQEDIGILLCGLQYSLRSNRILLYELP